MRGAVPFVLAPLALTAGCVTPITGFNRNLCVKDAVAVTSSWDAQLHRVFDRLWAVAAPDVRGADVSIVAVEGPLTLRTAWTCGDARRNTIAFTVRALGRLNSWRGGESLVAVTVAHELAHVVLHQGRSSGSATDAEEMEADALGIFYFERAGYDCRRWAGGEGYAVTEARQRAAEAACADAKRGVRPARRR